MDEINDISVFFRKQILTVSRRNGLQYYDPLHTGYYQKSVRPVYPEEIYYHDTHFQVLIDWDDPYVWESLDHPIRYAQIERKMFPSGWRYYVVLYLEGNAPARHTGNNAVAGLDPGVSTAAAVFDGACVLEELAPECRKYNREIARLSRKTERSVRLHNPDNYDEDGKIRKGRHRCRSLIHAGGGSVS